MLRKLSKTLAWMLLVLLVLLVLVGAAAVSPRWAEPLVGPLRTVLVHAAAAAMSASLDGSLRIASLQGSLLRNPTLSGITLADGAGRTVASIDTLRLRYSLRGLLRGQLHLRAVEIVKPSLNLVAEADGRLNLERVLNLEPEPSEDTPLALSVRLDELALSDGHISLRLPQAPGTRTVEDIALRLRGEVGPEGVWLELQDLKARSEPSNVVLERFRGALIGTTQAIQFKDWLLQTGESTLMLSGTLPLGILSAERQPLAPPPGHGTGPQPGQPLPSIAAAGPATDARETRPLEPIRAGEASPSLADSRTQAAKPQAVSSSEAPLTLSLAPLDIGEMGRILGDRSLRGEVQGDISAVQVASALAIVGRLSAGEGSVELDARFDPSDQAMSYQGTLTVHSLDLSTLLDKPGLESKLNLRLQLLGKGFEAADRSARLRLRLQPSHVGAIDIRASEVSLNVYGERFEIDTFDLNTSILDAHLEGKIDLDGPSDLTYALALDPADLRQIIGAKILGGRITLIGQARGAWPQLTVTGALSGHDVRYENTRLDVFKLDYRASDLGANPQAEARLQAEKLGLGEQRIGQLSAQSSYAYAAEGEHRLHFALSTDEASPLYAQLAGHVTADHERQTLVVTQLKARFDDHDWRAHAPLRAVRSARVIRLEPVRIAHGNESIEFAGARVGDDFEDVYLRVTDLELGFFQGAFSLPPMVAGRLDAQAELSGDVTAPILKSSLRLRSTGEDTLPLERADASLNYQSGQLTSAVSVIQNGRPTIALRSALPLDLAAVPKPMEERLGDAPLRIDLELAHPDLAALSQALPELPQLAGTLEGTLTVAGTYDRFSVTGHSVAHDLGITGVVNGLQGALKLSASLLSAPSMAALREAIATHAVAVALPALRLELPTLRGQIEGEGSETALALQDALAQISAKWRGATLTDASAQLSMHADLATLPPLDFVSKARFESQRLTVEQLKLQTPASALDGAGELSLADRTMRFSLNLPQLELREFEPAVPADLPSLVTGTLELAGTVETPQLNAWLRYAGALVSAEASARLQQPDQPYRARVRLSSFDVAQFAPALSGQLSVLLDVQGSGLTLGAPEARIALDVASTDFDLAPGLGARIRSRIAGETVSVDLCDVTSEPLELSVRGIFSTRQSTDLRYQLMVRDLTALEQRLGVALQASGELTGRVSGAIDALQGQNRLELNAWRYGQWTGAGLVASVNGRALASAPRVSVQAHIKDVQGPQWSPSSLQLEGAFGDKAGTFSLEVTEGPLRNSLVAGAIATEPVLRLRLDPIRLETEQWTWINMAPVQVLKDAQGVLTMRNFKLRNKTQRISARGSLTPSGALEGDLQIQGVRIKPTISPFAPTAPIPDGQLSLRIDLGGSIDRPRLKGTAQLANLQWSEQPIGEVRAEFASQGSAWQGNAAWRDDGDLLLRVDGSLDADTAKSIALDLAAPAFDLAKLQSFSPAIQQSAGQLRIDLKVRGTLDRPSANGVLELRDGRFLHSAIGEPYSNIQTRAVFRGNRLDLERLEVGSSTGIARLRGWLETNGLALGRTNLTLYANQFTAVKNPAIEAVVSSNVSVQGSQDAVLASGRVTIPRARIRYENLPASGTSDVEPWELTVEGVYGPGPQAATFGAAEVAAVDETKADPLSFVQADIELDMPRNIWLQGKGTAIELSGKLGVKKDLGQPLVLTGDLETLRGFATFLSRKFTLERGLVTFTGSEDINPVLDISASYEVSDYTVYVNITGESKKPNIAYLSEPELNQEDILSLLLFGKTADRLTSSEQTTLGSKAEQFAGGLAAGVLEQTVGKVLGLDTVAIELGDQGSASSIGAGRYLTQDIYVAYERKFRDPRQGNRTGNAVTVEYSINRDLKIEATGSDYGETALDFVWSRDY